MMSSAVVNWNRHRPLPWHFLDDPQPYFDSLYPWNQVLVHE